MIRPRTTTGRHSPATPVEPLEGRLLFAAALDITKIGGLDTGGFDVGAAEISAFDADTQRLFVVNAQDSTVDILDLSDPSAPALLSTIDISPFGSPNSVDVSRNVVAVAVEAHDPLLPGKVAFYKTNGQLISTVPVGVLPDMITFTPDGRHVLTANEGQPSEDYTFDPEGSVSVIRVPAGIGNVKKLSASDSRTAGFAAFNDDAAALRAAGVRIYGPGASAAQDFEPEYVAVSDDSRTAYVTLQENNAYAVVDVETATVTDVVPFGYKDHGAAGNELDASDRDNAINIRNWPVFGMYLPDAIKSYTAGGQTYLVVANEGDVRDYDGFKEDATVGSSMITLDPTAFPNAADLKLNRNLGRLLVTKTLGDTDGDGDYDELYAFGARSFTIFSAAGDLVYDSGADFERITATRFPANFNASNTNNTFDDRSDAKGPEPEGLTMGVIDGRTYAFVGLERVGGFMVYDVTNPAAPTFVDYVNTRNFAANPMTPEAGDLGPEGLIFIAAEESPTGQPLLVTSNEVSGGVAVYQIIPGAAAPVAPFVAPPVTRSASDGGSRAPAHSFFADGGQTVARIVLGDADDEDELVNA